MNASSRRLFLFVLVLLMASAAASAGSSPGALQSVRQATVFVKVGYDFGLDMPKWSWCGAGFFIDSSGHVLTSAHVAENEFDVPLRQGMSMHVAPVSKSIILVIDSGALDSREVKATVVASDRNLDLALLKTDHQPIDFVDVGTVSPVTLLTKVWSIGFPSGGIHSADEFDFSDIAQNPGSLTTSGKVASLRRDDDRTLVQVQTDIDARPGYSGAPLVDGHGDLAGVCSFRMSESERANLAVAPNLVQEFVLRHTTISPR